MPTGAGDSATESARRGARPGPLPGDAGPSAVAAPRPPVDEAAAVPDPGGEAATRSVPGARRGGGGSSRTGPARARVAVVTAVVGLAAVAAAFGAAGVSGQPVAGPALLFLLAGPGAALGWALPGQALRLRLLVGLFGGPALDTLIAQSMLSLRLWSPRGAALAALALTAALLCVGAFGTRRRAGLRGDGAADPGDHLAPRPGGAATTSATGPAASAGRVTTD